MPREHAVLANDAGSVYMIVEGKVSVQSSMLVGVHNCSDIKCLCRPQCWGYCKTDTGMGTGNANVSELIECINVLNMLCLPQQSISMSCGAF